MSTGALRAGNLLSKKYRLEHVLGVGGMGVVWAARLEPSGERVAVKVLSPERASDERLVRRFLYEARAAAKLRGEHVARLCEVGALDDGVPFLVMELLDGISLSRYLRAHGPLPPAEAVGWVLQVCQALVEAHDAGIVHRDLKPANLFLADRPDGSRVLKVLDFGIAKRLDGSTFDATTQGSLLGSPSYMAPEQISDPGKVDPRADVWAVGVILFELISGQKPFSGVSLPETLAQVLHADPPALLELCPDLPAGLASVVHGCLEKDRDRRVDSAEALARALAPFTIDERQTLTPSEPPSGLDATEPLMLSPFDPNYPTRVDQVLPAFEGEGRDAGDDAVPSLSTLETLVVATRRDPRALPPPAAPSAPPPSAGSLQTVALGTPPAGLPAWPLPADEDSVTSPGGPWPGKADISPFAFSFKAEKTMPLSVAHERVRPMSGPPPGGHHGAGVGGFSPPMAPPAARPSPTSPPPGGSPRALIVWPERGRRKLKPTLTALVAASVGWGLLAAVLVRHCSADASSAPLPAATAAAPAAPAPAPTPRAVGRR
ncbi:MAG TPA: serine/threonine-protein kinase [Polyangiaceae bacterium]|nr:serine/threonine-protein kinase [Polyangiaceae bacterium]